MSSAWSSTSATRSTTTELVARRRRGPAPPRTCSTRSRRRRPSTSAPRPRRRATCSTSTLRDAGLSLHADAASAPSPPTSARTPGASRSSSSSSSSTFGEGSTLGVDDVEPYLGEQGAVPGYQLTNDDRGGRHRRRARHAAPHAHRGEPVSSRSRCTRCRSSACCTGTTAASPRLDDPEIRNPADAVAALGGRVKEYPARKALSQARGARHRRPARGVRPPVRGRPRPQGRARDPGGRGDGGAGGAAGGALGREPGAAAAGHDRR